MIERPSDFRSRFSCPRAVLRYRSRVRRFFRSVPDLASQSRWDRSVSRFGPSLGGDPDRGIILPTGAPRQPPEPRKKGVQKGRGNV